MKINLVVSKYVKINEQFLVHGVFWKHKHARQFAEQLIKKKGTLNYKLLYKIITFKLPQQSFAN